MSFYTFFQDGDAERGKRDSLRLAAVCLAITLLLSVGGVLAAGLLRLFGWH